jgi:hypothetical protein
MSPTVDEINNLIQLQRRAERARISGLKKSYRAGDSGGFHENMTSDGFPWRLAFRWFATLSNVPKPFQAAFQDAWCDTKGPLVDASSHATLCKALRAMLPPYVGRRSRQLFRGATLREHATAKYGMSWSASIEAARDFARAQQESAESLREIGISEAVHDAAVFETLAPPEAIIAKVTYPEPFTAAEKAASPDAIFVERHHEQEFLVDYRLLQSVIVRQL